MEPNANIPYVNLVYNSLIFPFAFYFVLENFNFTLCSCYRVLIANMLVFIIISSFVLFNLCFLF